MSITKRKIIKPNRYFCDNQFQDMEQEPMDMEQKPVMDPESKKKDIAYSWVSTSRFLFYCQLAIALALTLGIIWGMYVNRYKGKPTVEVPSNTMYNPTYK